MAVKPLSDETALRSYMDAALVKIAGLDVRLAGILVQKGQMLIDVEARIPESDEKRQKFTDFCKEAKLSYSYAKKLQNSARFAKRCPGATKLVRIETLDYMSKLGADEANLVLDHKDFPADPTLKNVQAFAEKIAPSRIKIADDRKDRLQNAKADEEKKTATKIETCARSIAADFSKIVRVAVAQAATDVPGAIFHAISETAELSALSGFGASVVQMALRDLIREETGKAAQEAADRLAATASAEQAATLAAKEAAEKKAAKEAAAKVRADQVAAAKALKNS